MREILFKTIHGSHLYNLATPASDIDYFTVVTKAPQVRKRYAKQSIVDGIDSTVVDLGTFMTGCEKGVPQFLEAMFSPVASVDKIADLRKDFFVGTGVLDTYLRTIKSFALSDTYKTKRHALRLALNVNEILHTGRFRPNLSSSEVTFISHEASGSKEEALDLAYHVVWC